MNCLGARSLAGWAWGLSGWASGQSRGGGQTDKWKTGKYPYSVGLRPLSGSGEAVVFELTCPWDDNINRSHAFTEEKYAPLIAYLSRNFKTYHFSVEVSVCGQVSRDNKQRLKALTYRVCSDPKPIFKSLVQNMFKSALLSSFSIFSAWAEPTWVDPPYLVTHWLFNVSYYWIVS